MRFILKYTRGSLDPALSTLFQMTNGSCEPIEGCCKQGSYRTKGSLLVKLKLSLRKFYGRHHDLLKCYGISVSQMTKDMFQLS